MKVQIKDITGGGYEFQADEKHTLRRENGDIVYRFIKNNKKTVITRQFYERNCIEINITEDITDDQ